MNRFFKRRQSRLPPRFAPWGLDRPQTFDSRDDRYNDYLGWYVDDVRITWSTDCNGNGIPDECEPDCNANGVPDDCDIAQGISQDCQPNGIPDECDIITAVHSGSGALTRFTRP